MAKIKVSLFGAGHVQHQERGPLAFHGRKAVALLAYVLIESGSTQRRDKLAGLLWPELDDKQALTNLRVTLNRLKKGLGETQTPYLLSNRQSLQPNPEADLWLDVKEFSSLVQQMWRHPHESRASCAACQPRLIQAAELYRAEFLEGFFLEGCQAFEEWQLMQREQYHLEAIEVFADLSQYYDDARDLKKAEHYTRQQLKLEPLREDAQRRLMRLLAFQGQRSSAAEHFQQFEQRMLNELGLAPETETLHLLEQIQENRVTNTKQLDPDYNSALPVPLTPFIGREDELVLLNERLDLNERLLSIVGAGGVGKSRLVLELAHKQVGQFADGAVFVPLVDLRAADNVPLAILERLNIPASNQYPTAAAHLMSALKNKHLLLVLDNLEHLMGTADFIVELLKNTQRLVVVVTSRERLNLQAEDLFLLKGLPVPDKAELDSPNQTTFSSYASVRLFVERANRISKQFRLNETNMHAVGRICQLLDGIPLALELAASWVHDLGCEDIARVLSHNLDSLQTQFRDIEPHHRSMQAVFDYSWRLLANDEQQILAGLSVFRGSFSAEAASTVLSVNVRMLARLSHKSLVHPGDKKRYSLHELTRQFAAQKVSDGQDLRQRHGDFYLALLNTYQDDLIGLEPRIAALILQQDLDNIRSAWHWACEHQNSKSLLKGFTGMAHFYDAIGLYQEGLERFQRTIATVKKRGFGPEDAPPHDADLVMGLIFHAGNFAIKLNELELANALSQELIGLAKTLNNPGYELQGTVRLGEVLHHLGRYRESHDLLISTLSRIQSAGLKALEGQCFIALGSSNRGNYDERLVYVERALEIQQKLGNRTLEQNALIKLSIDSCEQHDYDTFRRYSQQALGLSDAVGHAYNSAVALFLVGRHHSDMGQWQKAIEFHKRAHTIFKQIGDRWLESFTLHNLCHVHTMTGQLGLAMQEGQQALALVIEDGTLDAMSFAHTYFGYSLLAHPEPSQLELAHQSFETACAGWQKLERPALNIENVAGLALVCLELGDVSAAAKHISTILDYLNSGETLAGADLPLRIYWTCYRVFAELQDERVHRVLDEAYHQLTTHSGRISDARLQHSFLTNVPVNHLILSTWKTQSSRNMS